MKIKERIRKRLQNISGGWVHRGLPLVIICGLGVGGGWLAVNRIFQADEVQTAHMAWLLTRSDANEYFNSAEVYMIPMSFLSRAFRNPVDYLVACRLIFYGLFICSCLILAHGVAGRDRDKRFGALLLLGTTPILWDYGFEVRHDNIVIFGLALMIWILFNERAGRPDRSLFWGGCLGSLLFMSSLKSIVLWGPILGFIALFAIMRRRISFPRASMAVMGGFILTGVLVCIGHLLLGSLPLYIKASRSFFEMVGGASIRFFKWTFVLRFVRMHLWMIAIGLLYLLFEAPRIVKGWLSKEQSHKYDYQAKGLMLLVIGPAFIALNPTPFPYNYMYIAVLAFPAVFWLTEKALHDSRVRRGLIFLAFLILQGIPFFIRITRHFSYRNESQKKVMAYLNAYTDPEECVFDGSGLTMFRKGPGEVWYLHSLNKRRYLAGALPPVRDMLARKMCPILIQSYKWRFMQPEDLEFINSRYVRFQRAVWIMGRSIQAFASGSYSFAIFRDGYYVICSEDMRLARGILVDRAPLSSRAVFLRKGMHMLDVEEATGKLFVLWVKNERFLPSPVPELTLPLFVNWY